MTTEADVLYGHSNQEYGADNPIEKSGKHGISEHTWEMSENTKKIGLLLYLIDSITAIVQQLSTP
jgi:hypothetical protein